MTTNINTLMEEGLVTEAGVAKSTGGRKPVILKFEADARFAFGVDITPDKVATVLVNLNYDVLSTETFAYDGHMNFDQVLEKVSVAIDSMLGSMNIERSQVVGVGFSLPGLVDENKLILQSAPNIDVKDYDFTDFQTRVGYEVSIENEANIAAFAEATIGVATNKSKCGLHIHN